MRATWTSYNFRRTHYSEKLFERDSFGLIWNFAFHGLNNFRLLTRGEPWSITPLLVIIQLHTFFSQNFIDFIALCFFRTSGVEPGKIKRVGEGGGKEREEVQVQGKENGKLGYEDVASNRCYSEWMFSPYYAFSTHGLNTVETTFGGRIWNWWRHVRRGEITVNH